MTLHMPFRKQAQPRLIPPVRKAPAAFPRVLQALPVMLMLLLPGKASAQLSFSTTVDLALSHSPKVRAAVAGVARAQAGLESATDVYLPGFVAGSSLGYSYGFPVGQPSIYSVRAHSLVFSFSQRDYIRSARAAVDAAELQLKAARQQVITQAALDYIELDTVHRQILALRQENDFADRLISIEEARVQAGWSSKVSLTKARLQAAQVRLQSLQLADREEFLRSQLAHLTGMAPADMTPEAGTIPPAPAAAPRDNYDAEIVAWNDNVKAAYADAKSKLYTAFGDDRQNNRPTIAFGLEYNRYAEFNNYNEYFLRFQHNNFNVGIQIEIPLFDWGRKAAARGSSAAAAAARAEADELRNQTSESTLKLRRNMDELAAQEQVAELQQQLAQDQLASVTTRIQQGNGNPNQPALTPREEEEARIEERSRFVDLLNAKFQLTQARLELLRSLGKIEDWAKSLPATPPNAR